MKATVYKHYYCFEYTHRWSWYEVDSPFCHSAWSEQVYAETAGKARYKAFMSLDLDREDFTSIKVRRKSDNDLVENPEVHPLWHLLTQQQIHKMRHAVGADNMSHRNWFYRNRYVSGIDEDWELLIRLGLANKHQTVVCPEWVYYLTEEGVKAVSSTLPIYRWQFNKKFNSIPNDERSATQQTLNQGYNAD